jgi:hypothetical protein
MFHVKDRRRVGGFVFVLACATAAFTVSVAGSGAARSATGATAATPINLTNEFAPNRGVNLNVPNSQSAAHVPASHVPRPQSKQVVASNPGFAGFAGLTHFDQRTADGGNQFSLEPPDQGLCVGNGRVIEPVNDVFAIYDAATGTKLSPATGVTSLTVFFTGQHQVVRTSPTPFGPFVSDPKCYFDPALNRFFMTVVEIDQDPVTGAFTGRSHQLLAVSKTDTPSTSSSVSDSNGWYIYSIDTTNNGTLGTPSHPGCPCFGDQPLIGADANTFVITTNEFSLFPFGAIFNGAQIYVIDKAAAALGTLKFQFIGGSPIPLAEGPAFSLQPATSPSNAEWSSANGGTEFLLSDLDFDATLDNRLAVWALTNTTSITMATPDVHLSHVVIGSQVYGQPPDAQQKPGPTPLADITPNAFTGKSGNGPREHLELIAGNDDRMNQAVFAAGKLWGGVNTVVKTENGITHVGIAYFIVTPSFPNGGSLSATIAKQGYISVNGQNVLYPSIGVNSAGKGVVGFSLVGPDFFPSAAYAPIDAVNGAGDVHVAAAGAFPDDGLSGYRFFSGGNVGRWGDYSAAVADSSGKIWIGHEYIPNSPRTQLANWGTFVSQVTP